MKQRFVDWFEDTTEHWNWTIIIPVAVIVLFNITVIAAISIERQWRVTDCLRLFDYTREQCEWWVKR